MKEQRPKSSKSYQIVFTVCKDKINKLISSNTVARFKIGKVEMILPFAKPNILREMHIMNSTFCSQYWIDR